MLCVHVGKGSFKLAGLACVELVQVYPDGLSRMGDLRQHRFIRLIFWVQQYARVHQVGHGFLEQFESSLLDLFGLTFIQS